MELYELLSCTQQQHSSTLRVALPCLPPRVERFVNGINRLVAGVIVVLHGKVPVSQVGHRADLHGCDERRTTRVRQHVPVEDQRLELLEVVLAEVGNKRGNALVADRAAREDQLLEQRPRAQRRGEGSCALVADGVLADIQALELGHRALAEGGGESLSAR